MRTWGTNTSGPNTLLQESLPTVRSRSQHAYRNNPTARAMVDPLVTNMIGRGITPRWSTGDKQLDAQILDLWRISSTELSSDGILDIAGLQEMAARTFILSGDALCQYVYPKPTADLLVPFQIKLMESDQFYDDFNGLLPNGNNLLLGHEFDSSNTLVRYHLHKYHPGETSISAYSNPLDVVCLTPDNMLHIYQPYRPGQLRGWPRLANLLTQLKAIDEFEDGSLDAQKTSAMFSAYITRPDAEAVDPGIFGESVTYSGSEYLGLEPGTITSLLPGEDIKFATPPQFASAYEPWMRNQLLRISSSFGITYEQLTNDLRGANWATIRASLLEFQRRCRMLQFNILVHQFLRPLARAWLDTAILAKAIRIPRYTKYRRLITATTWDPDGWEWVDPLKHVQAEKIAIRCGIKSRSSVVSQSGNNSEVVDAEIAADNARADALGLVYDSDPRYSTDNTNNTQSNPDSGEGSATPNPDSPEKE